MSDIEALFYSINDITNWKLYCDGTLWYNNGQFYESFTKLDFESLDLYVRHIPSTRKYVVINPIFKKGGKLIEINTDFCFQIIEDVGKIVLIKNGVSYEVLYEPFKNKYCSKCYGTNFLHTCECQKKNKENM